MLTVRVRAGRLTRCRSKNKRACDNDNPNDDMDYQPLDTVLVHTNHSFHEGVSQPPYLIAAAPRALARIYVSALRPSQGTG